MQVLTDAVDFSLGLKAPIFIPVTMTVGSIIVGVKIKDTVSFGITPNAVFIGVNLLISFMRDSIIPTAQVIMISTGISLPIADGGWGTTATISWAWPYAFLVFPLLVTVNVVMILPNKTNTINTDLWNVRLKIFTAVVVVFTTHSVILASMVTTVQIILELRSLDAHQHRIEKLTGIPGVSVTHVTLFFEAILYPITLVLRKIPGLNRESDTDMLKDKVGIFTENHVMGFTLGCLSGILVRYSLAQILITGAKAAAAMTLFPVVAKYFIQALSPISKAVSALIDKKFEGKTPTVGLDQPILGGCNEIWLAVPWSVPFILTYLMVLPGNEVLPFADLMSTSLALLAFLVTRGSLLQMSILCVTGAPVLLWTGAAFAPFMTESVIATGSIDPRAGELISNSLINGPAFMYSVSHLFMFLKDNFMPLIILAVWPAGFALYCCGLIREAREDTALEVGNAEAGQ